MATKSTGSASGGKVKKQRRKPSDFPLFRHQSGRWCKKVKGKFCYFGKITDDPEGKAALDLWLEQRDDLLAGRKPLPRGQGLRLAKLVNDFLNYKRGLLESGELAQRTFSRYLSACERLAGFFGGDRPVDDLSTEDFQSMRQNMAKQYGPVALGNEVQMVRSVFKYGYDAGLLETPIRFGPGFKRPSAKTIRQARAKSGSKLFEASDIRKVLADADPTAAAMVLLGINGALGNTDVGLLPISAIDLDGGWLDYPRSKTAIPRRIPLWPETIEALREVLASRSKPKDDADDGLLFIGPRGESFVGNHKGYRVGNLLKDRFKEAGVVDRTFYDLRRTFQTIGDGSYDTVAVSSIMGHAPASGDMASIYRQGVSDDRLRAVVDHIRTWLWPKRTTKADGKRKPR